MQPTVIVFDSHWEALQRRLQTIANLAGNAHVVGTTSSTAVSLLAAGVPDGTPVLIDLLDTDRLSLDRPGERLIRRLRRNPATAHVVPIAWSAHRARDVVFGARRAGAAAFVSVSADEALEQAQLRRVLDGEELWPPSATADASTVAWEAWFAEQFGIPWEAWIEPTLARLASARERSALAPELVELEAAASRAHAATRMRTLARVVAGEHRNSAAAVASAAGIALVQIAAHRPLSERPGSVVSLERGARAIGRSSSLIVAAGLADDETREVFAIDALIRDDRARRPAQRGAPAGDEVRHERRWAAGRRAIERSGGDGPVDELIDGILAQLDEALVAIDDALQDELYHPEARAAAALQLVESGDVGELDGVTWADGAALWRGLTALELAVDRTQDVAELRALTTAVDACATGRLPRVS